MIIRASNPRAAMAIRDALIEQELNRNLREGESFTAWTEVLAEIFDAYSEYSCLWIESELERDRAERRQAVARAKQEKPETPQVAEQNTIDTCAYCDSEIADASIVPSADDDETWEMLAHKHRDGCEWIETRAHRLS